MEPLGMILGAGIIGYTVIVGGKALLNLYEDYKIVYNVIKKQRTGEYVTTKIKYTMHRNALLAMHKYNLLDRVRIRSNYHIPLHRGKIFEILEIYPEERIEANIAGDDTVFVWHEHYLGRCAELGITKKLYKKDIEPEDFEWKELEPISFEDFKIAFGDDEEE